MPQIVASHLLHGSEDLTTLAPYAWDALGPASVSHSVLPSAPSAPGLASSNKSWTGLCTASRENTRNLRGPCAIGGEDKKIKGGKKKEIRSFVFLLYILHLV